MNSIRLRRNMLLALGLGGCVAIQTVDSFQLESVAQPPGGEGRGRGGFDRGGFERGGFERGRGERGDRGGDRGSRGERFGGPGGGPGGPGGPGGSFDPSAFLSRMDRNGNGSIDPDEMEGPARFMLERLARNNPKIDLSKPIPLSVISEAAQQARGGSAPGAPSNLDDDYAAPASLVPGFGIKIQRNPVPGFGMSATLSNIPVEERDLKDADERIQRYDRNRDSMLDENELREGRWNDTPMQYDRNGDGKLNRDELAVRFAKRRMDSPPAATGTPAPPSTGDSGADRSDDAPPAFEKTASYRLNFGAQSDKRLQGLPEWFTRMDTNGDGQVSMPEFVRDPSDEAVADYARFDLNMDGFITPQEGLAAVKNGHVPGASSGSSAAGGTMASSRDFSRGESSGRDSGSRSFGSRDSRGGGFRGPTPSGPGSTGAAPGTLASGPTSNIPAATRSPDESDPNFQANLEKIRKWLEPKFKGYDKNGNGFVELDEYKAYKPSGDFSKADLNKDGKLDLDELARDRMIR